MKCYINFSILIFFSFCLNPADLDAQEGHWVFKEIIHGNHFGSQNLPTKIELDVNEGVIEFSLPQQNNCTDKYRFTYKFAQDMNVLSIPIDKNNIPTYSYESELTPLGSPCYDPVVSSYSNPLVAVTHWNASSGLLGTMKKNNTWKYKYHQEFLNNGGYLGYYAHKTKVYKTTGKHSGEYKVIGPYQKDVDYTLKSRPGMATDFRILFKGQSSISGKEDDFYYDILFIYELVDGPIAEKDSPCDISAPDCSCCPGTIPVWNFKTKSGDCICPEGKVWDKINNRCK